MNLAPPLPADAPLSEDHWPEETIWPAKFYCLNLVLLYVLMLARPRITLLQPLLGKYHPVLVIVKKDTAEHIA